MSTKTHDQEIIAVLTKKVAASPKAAEYDNEGNLIKLSLTKLWMFQLSPVVRELTSLQVLDLSENQLSQLPPEIGQLTSLQTLILNKNQLSQLPPEIGQLTSLQTLDLDENQLSQFPPEIIQLTNLQTLFLDKNQLSQLPPEIGQLTSLQVLTLNENQLSQLPPEIGQFTSLQWLYLISNQLSQLPPEIVQLTNLHTLTLGSNQLSQLPFEIGQLTNLQNLILANNPDLLTPPPEIVSRGTTDILAFFRELQEKSAIRYEAKLLIVGEGGTGKSSLLRALLNDMFDPHLPTTHGIDVVRLKLSHSYHTIILNTWDFGGQHIYHTTHQLFLTKRSLYVVVWNARLGAEQGRLHYWLETIKPLAPDAPVLLVATHIDERPPDLNYQLYKNAYPQLIGNLGVSNKNGEGIAQLEMELAKQAIQLPLMGQPWPQRWLEIEKTLLNCPEQYIDKENYAHYCSINGVEADIASGTLGNYLHDLGKILYFRDDYLLSNLVVLKPNWVTKAISRVLDDEKTSVAKGILLHSELPRIWTIDEEGHPYESYLYPVFLRLMERFELSYQIEVDTSEGNSISSLIPQLLPHQPPVNLPAWPKAPTKGQSQVEIVYRLDSVPAGIMSRFIVRTHRYTQNLHWREGVMLEYQGHQARAELNPMLRELRLLVQGPLPQNFFTILMNTLDVILTRFEGLTIERRIPCICHWERGVVEPCSRFYHYEDLVRRMAADRYKVECPDTFVEVAVPMLLYGIHSSTNEQVMADIQQGQKEIQKSLKELQKLDIILQKLDQQSELIARSFTRQWNLEMNKLEVNCPNTFILMPGSDSIFNPKNWVSKEYRLYLICQHPSGPHRVGEGYRLRKTEEWWTTVSPWLNHLIIFLKYAIPMGKAIEALHDINAKDVKQLQATISLIEEITKSMPELPTMDEMKDVVKRSQMGFDQSYVGSALRALYSFLKEADHNEIWGGLRMTPTPDGNILWLCSQHRQQYELKKLHLEA